jgi:outer membrane lipoprotein-sorting protein
MSFFRHAPTRRVLAVIAGVVAAGIAATAIALAASGGGPVPPAKPLPTAIHDALVAPPVQGLSARIKFTDHLIDAGAMQGGGPLLAGGSGRLWFGGDRKFRLEVQSSDGNDAQIVSDGSKVTIYDPASNDAYEIALPPEHSDGTRHDGPPTIADIRKSLGDLAKSVDIAGPTPTDVAGQGAYSVRLSPKHDGGLLGAAEVAWDAARGVPLRVGIYAQGKSDPVLELTATNVQYGPVAASTFTVKPPADAKVTTVSAPSGGGAASKHGKDAGVTGLDAVRQKLSFKLSAPDTLAGLPRRDVRLLDSGDGSPGALVAYGQGLGGLLVLEQPSKAGDIPAGGGGHGRDGERFSLPTLSINGATGVELATALGTGVRFERGGVTYTVLGSVPPAAAEAAARGL